MKKEIILIKDRVSNSKERRRNIPISFAVMLIVAIIIMSEILFSNNMKGLKIREVNKSGSSDVRLIFNSEVNRKKIDNIISNSDVKKKVNFNIIQGGNITFNDNPVSIDIYETEFNDYNYMEKINIVQGSISKLPNDIVVNKQLMKKLGAKLNDYVEVEVDGIKTECRIAAVTENYASTSDKDTIFISSGILNGSNTLSGIFLDLNHNTNNAKLLIQKINNSYGDKVKVFDDYQKYVKIEKDMKFLQNSLLLLVAIIVFLGCSLIINTYTIIINERIKFWAVLRTIGLKYREMVYCIVLENLFYSCIGIVLGIALGIALGCGVCTLTATPILSFVPSFEFILICIVVGGVLPIVSVLIVTTRFNKKTPYELIKAKDEVIDSSKNDPIKITLGIIAIAIPIIIHLVCNSNNLTLLSCGILFALFIVGIISLVPYIIVIIGKLLKLKVNRTTFLVSNNMSNNFSKNKGLACSFLLIILIQLSLSNTIKSYHNWAREQVDKQLRYDIEINYKYTDSEESKVQRIIKKIGNIEPIGSIYEGQAKSNLGDQFNYCVTSKSVIREMYNQNLFQNGLQYIKDDNNDVVISQELADNLHKKINSQLEIIVGEKKENVRIADVINTMDYSGRVIFSFGDKDQFKPETCRIPIKYINEKNGFDTEDKIDQALFGDTTQKSKEEIKEERKQKSKEVDYNDRNGMKYMWQENVMEGMLPIEVLFFTIELALMTLLVNTCVMTISENKKQLALLMSIGLSKISTTRIAFLEIALLFLVVIVVGIFGSSISTEYLVGIFNKASNGGGVNVPSSFSVLQSCMIGILVLIVSLTFMFFSVRKSVKCDVVKNIKDE